MDQRTTQSPPPPGLLGLLSCHPQPRYGPGVLPIVKGVLTVGAHLSAVWGRDPPLCKFTVKLEEQNEPQEMLWEQQFIIQMLRLQC